MPFQIEPYENERGYWIKSFLADDQFNSNDWRIDRRALERDHETFVGQKFVLTWSKELNDYIHPEFEEQEDYATGTIIKTGFDPTVGKAWFEGKIEDPAAIKAIKDRKVKFISPGLTATEWFELDDGRKIITRFEGEHVAGVTRPAFGKYKAQIKGQCAGSYGECKQILMHVQACEGCQLQLVSTAADNSHNRRIVTSKSEMGDKPADTGNDTSKGKQTVQDECPEGQHMAEGKCVEKETAALKARLTDLENKNKDLIAKLDASEKKPIVERIVAAKIEMGKIKEEAKATETDSLMKRAVDDLSFIATELETFAKERKDMVATIPAGYRKHFSASEDESTDEKAGDKFMLGMRRGD